jgi:hypothetical protein
LGKGGCQHEMLHELGHLFGGRHDRYENGETDPHAYNFGFVNLPARIYTVMAYPDKCLERNPPVTNRQRIAFFSTPLIRPEGERIGIAPISQDAADMARWLNEQGAYVAGFR